MTQAKTGAKVQHMKSIKWITISALLYSTSDAAQFEVRGYGPILNVETSIQKGESVSRMTATLLARAKESHLISNYFFNGLGVESITPLGQAPLGFFVEAQNEKELRAYGWCYSVDGITPDLLADEYRLQGTEEKITWYFGFATRILGNWETQCTPVSF